MTDTLAVVTTDVPEEVPEGPWDRRPDEGPDENGEVVVHERNEAGEVVGWHKEASAPAANPLAEDAAVTVAEGQAV